MPKKTGPSSTTEKGSEAEAILEVATAAAWDRWLKSHHGKSTGIWLRIPKGPTRAFGYAEALDVALVWGWIDSQKRTLDEVAFIQRFSPRKVRSPWSKINREKAEVLISAKKMQLRGLEEVERAKADGRWEAAYDSARNSTVPDDLTEALSQRRGALAFFEKLSGANRYAILYRVQTAKKAETRAERIRKFAEMCARGETIH
ncbi:MAG: YdeI/OmpD-associated family protein [Vicinamibacteria bacterium]